MADENVINDLYRLSIDEAALARLKSGIKSGRQAIEEITAATKAQPVAFDQAAKAADSYAKSVAKSEEARKSASTSKSSVNSSQSLGKAESGINQIAQLLPGAGGDSARLLGDVTGTIQKLPELGKSIRDLGPSAIATGAGVAGLSVALALYDQEVARSKALAMADIDARQRALTLLQTGSREEIQTRINQLAKQAEINKATAADANKLFQDLKDQTLKTLGPAAAALEFYASQVGKAAGPYQAASEAAAAANKNLNSTSTELELLEKSSGLAAQSVGEAVTALQKAQFIGSDISNRASADLEAYQLANSGSSKQLNDRLRSLQLELAVTANSAAAARSRAESLGLETEAGQAAKNEADGLTKKQNALQVSLEVLSQSFIKSSINARELADYTKQLVETTAQIIIENQKYDQIKADRVKEDSRSAALEAQQAIIDNDKKIEAAKEASDKISEIAKSGAEEEAKALSDMYAERDKINADAMQRELELLADYQKSESRAQQDYSKERVRKLQDLYTDLTSIAASRDVSAFISRRNSGLTDLQRNDEDYGTAAARRHQDYLDQVAEAERSRRQQLADLATSFEKERGLRAVKLQEELTQVAAASTARIKQSDIDQKKLNDLRAMYAKQDIDSRRRIEDQAHVDTIAKLAQRQRELGVLVGSAFNPVINTFGLITNAVVNFLNAVRAAASSPVTSSSSSAARASTSNNPTRGVSSLGISGNAYVPAWGKGNGGNTIVLNIAGVGSLVSTAELNATVERIIGGFEQAVGVK